MTARTKRRLEEMENAFAQQEDASKREIHIQLVASDGRITRTVILRGNGREEIIPKSPEVENPEG
jgi:hypothetical protein